MRVASNQLVVEVQLPGCHCLAWVSTSGRGVVGLTGVCSHGLPPSWRHWASSVLTTILLYAKALGKSALEWAGHLFISSY